MRAKNEAEVAILDGEMSRLTGEAEAEAQELKETARSAIAGMKMDIFRGEGQSFLRYSLAEEINPDLRLRLFQSGPGTFWTNMTGSEGMNLLLQPGVAPLPARGKTEASATAPQKGPSVGQ
jgi:hypothetical protein